MHTPGGSWQKFFVLLSFIASLSDLLVELVISKGNLNLPLKGVAETKQRCVTIAPALPLQLQQEEFCPQPQLFHELQQKLVSFDTSPLWTFNNSIDSN